MYLYRPALQKIERSARRQLGGKESVFSLTTHTFGPMALINFLRSFITKIPPVAQGEGEDAAEESDTSMWRPEEGKTFVIFTKYILMTFKEVMKIVTDYRVT